MKSVVHFESCFCFIGASAPNPDLLFVLTQKVSKKTPHPSVS
jgi:hypothetical protein